jgi:hypothetical protein
MCCLDPQRLGFRLFHVCFKNVEFFPASKEPDIFKDGRKLEHFDDLVQGYYRERRSERSKWLVSCG